MFVSKKKIEEFQNEFYLARGGLARLQARVEVLEEDVKDAEKALEECKIYTTRELTEVYKKLVSVQKEFSRKITDDCEKEDLLKMIEALREKLDTSLSKLYGDMLELRDSADSKDDEEKTIASVMDEYLNGGKENE